ncbi:MAG: excinuclease ABC subunit UvrA [Bacteroidales bacterium]|nr:excinuclease ABC subunit UvrA [Lentimicrobiaceae bacterium]MDD5694698.1 excinuclease ABC subunit UvrA [Bacteroidales bacterium]
MLFDSLEHLDPHDFIVIKGARVHNLKNLSVALPRNHLIVITGLSGSGKSSLAFDTLYADGQRRYVESLSSYARQFLGRMSKPEVDFIRGIAPAIAIEQKVNTRNPRSTVGTSTEIYEYLKLLYARVGKTYSPVSGELVKRHSVTDVVDYIRTFKPGTRFLIYCPLIVKANRTLKEQLSILLQQGFSRMYFQQEIVRIDGFLSGNFTGVSPDELFLLIDRMVYEPDDEDLLVRVADSAQLAFYEGEGSCRVESSLEDQKNVYTFSNRFERDGVTFEEPSTNLFSFNNPYGACKRCEGFGSIIGIDEDLVIPNKSLSITEDAIACWKGEKMSEWKDVLVMNAYRFGFPIYKPYYELTGEQKELLWTGNEYFSGLNDFFKYVEEQTYKIQYRVMLSRYRGKTVCPDCKGTRLRKDARYVKVGGKSISDVVLMPVSKSLAFFRNLELADPDRIVASRLLTEIVNRLQFLEDVGLGYLTLNRLASSLSGGESQRINLATSLGSNLVGSMYILDEPSIGLHPRDTHRLIRVLLQLRDLGNTVIVVEHDEDIIRAADQIIDIGPMAGSHGGELVFQGSYDELIHDTKSLTGQYMARKQMIPLPRNRRPWKDYIEVTGARENNLKGISVQFPLQVFTCVTGVSGSGKTTLVKTILYAALKKIHGGYTERTGNFDRLDGDFKRIGNIELVDQNPIGRSTRSNPATYVKAYDDIRQLFADQQLARVRGYKPGFFSFNIPGGRCEECEGEGTVRIEMQFMADIYLTCESCGGKRFREEVLDVRYKDYTISDILDLTISQGIQLFGSSKKKNSIESRIVGKLQPLEDVGLGYLKLGQSSSTLSGGEAQRTKLAYFLAKGATEVPTFFIFDEPTTGLHYHDIHKLLEAFHALIERGHTILVIEHNLEVIKCADWIIDLGPEGGDEGGTVVFEGTPENMAAAGRSYTAHYLRQKLMDTPIPKP